ncbi:hypothetical protein V2J09_023899 [Rumex salicifolius]
MAGIRRNNSGMTNDDSTGFADQEETSSLDSIEWTNEKHSMYLKSMEASFIDQLYNSKDLFSWCLPEEQGLDGSSQRELYNTALQPEGSISRMMIDGEHHQDSLSFDEEVSDQNFVNNVCENRAASGQRAKRPRTQDALATSSNDQELKRKRKRKRKIPVWRKSNPFRVSYFD